MVQNSTREIILTLDVGTSSIRCLAFSGKGEILANSSYEYAPTYHPNGQVRQSPSDWENGAVHVLSRTVEILGTERKKIAAVSVTSQRASLIAADGNGTPLYDAIMWHDKTTSPYCPRIAERMSMEEMYARTGLRIDSYFTAPKILWLRDNQPDLYSRAETFFGVQDYVAYVLTGRRVTDYSQASRTLLFNIWEHRWDPGILEALEIEARMLPEVLQPGGIGGKITAETADRTGIPEGIPVILAGGDQQVAALGMGIFDHNTAEVNTGTGSFVITLTDSPVVHPEMKTLCSCSAIPDRWVAEAGVLTTGIVYNWFARELGFWRPEETDRIDYAEIDRLIQSAPPGSNGLITLPHFKGAAAPFWNQNARGLFFNVTLAHKRGDFARSIIESIALEIGSDIRLLNEIPQIDTGRVIVAGGMTSFDLFNQIQADVYGVPVLKNPHTEATSFGAFLSAQTGLGHYPTVYEAYEAYEAYESRGGLQGGSEDASGRTYQPDSRMTGLYTAIGRQREALYRALESNGIYDAVPSLEETLSSVGANAADTSAAGTNISGTTVKEN